MENTTQIWKRIVPGEYSNGTWTISRIDFGYGPEWMAQKIEESVVLDPLPTLKAAKEAVTKCK